MIPHLRERPLTAWRRSGPRSGRRLAAAWVVALLPWLSSACTREAPDRPRNLILISIDTLRADRLGCYGYERPTSPFLDGFAREGVVFESTVAQSPWTVPSHATMLTGLLPVRHGVTGGSRVLAPAVPTLASLLAGAGFDTRAVVSSSWFRRQAGFQRGFAGFDDDPAGRGQAVARQALEWLAGRGDGPFFLFMHFYDVHSDYTPGPRERAELVGDYAGPVDGSTSQLIEVRGGTRTLSPADVRHLSELYDAEILQLDRTLAGFFGELERRGLAQKTVVIITSDHGEEFMEHGGVLHGRTAFEEVLRVPLILRGPGVPRGQRVRSLAMLADIVPTALSLLGVESSAAFDGIDLVPRMRGEAPTGADRLVYAGADHGNVVDDMLSMLRNERFKLIQDHHTPRTVLYDMQADPEERVDVAKEHPDVVEELLRALEALRAGRYVGEEGPPLDEDELQDLRRLGYF